MHIRDYLRSFWSDWITLMSGVASVLFTFWAIAFEPTNINLKYGLWVVSAACFVIASYRIWSAENAEVQRLRTEAEQKNNLFIQEFEEIRANILFSSLDIVIARELAKFKEFFHKHPELLKLGDIGEFYETFILQKEIHLEYGAELDFKQSDYDEMKRKLDQITLRAADF